MGGKSKNIDDDFRLTAIKPLHAQWLMNMFNFFTSQKGADAIIKDCKKAGIVGVLEGTIVLPSEDPFVNSFEHCHVNWFIQFIIS